MDFILLIILAVPTLITLLRAREIKHNSFCSAGFLYYRVLLLGIGYFSLAATNSNAAYRNWANMFAGLLGHRVVIFAASISVLQDAECVVHLAAETGKGQSVYE
ncbi:hypothetical protein [Acidobacterium sp.]|uniref:hypothetical protein n=1 Tax=Acidobacterium sp. TaxID=1872119 RepID=UPI0025811A29|nr:hypothetical protein [Acidobacterium sp.]